MGSCFLMNDLKSNEKVNLFCKMSDTTGTCYFSRLASLCFIFPLDHMKLAAIAMVT